MKVLGVLARKGGAGKTTLAAHLAVLAGQVAPRRVLMIDTDPQKSLTKWWRRRPVDQPELAEVPIEKLAAALEAAREDGVDLVVIDSRPSVEADTVKIAGLADFCVVPCRPAILDIDAVRDTVELLARIKRPAALVLNACPARRGAGEATLVVDARRAVGGLGLPVSPVAIGDRVALSYALTDGRAVTEFDPEGKASTELRALWSWLEETAWPRPRRAARA